MLLITTSPLLLLLLLITTTEHFLVYLYMLMIGGAQGKSPSTVSYPFPLPIQHILQYLIEFLLALQQSTRIMSTLATSIRAHSGALELAYDASLAETVSEWTIPSASVYKRLCQSFKSASRRPSSPTSRSIIERVRTKITSIVNSEIAKDPEPTRTDFEDPEVQNWLNDQIRKERILQYTVDDAKMSEAGRQHLVGLYDDYEPLTRPTPQEKSKAHEADDVPSQGDGPQQP
jgi:hypothetical protein